MSTEDVFLIDYARLVSPWAFYPITIAISLLAFILLYTIADHHLNRSLDIMAAVLKMSPAIAGMTLLAFGNGASDFFTAVLGVGEAPAMIVGSSVGSGLFITLVVMGASIIFSAADKCIADVVSDDVEKSAVTSCTDDTHGGIKLDKSAFKKSIVVYLLCASIVVWFGYRRVVYLWQPICLIVLLVLYIGWAVYGHYQRQRTYSIDDEHELESADDVKRRLLMEAHLDKFESESSFRRVGWVVGTWWKLTSADPFSLISTPIRLVLAMTIPPLCPREDASSSPLRLAHNRIIKSLRLAVSPFFTTAFLLMLYEMVSGERVNAVAIIVAFATTFLVYVLMMKHLRRWREAPSPSMPTAMLSFAVCILWIYAITNELLNALTAIARRTGISDATLGLTILAWGNSCGDLISNIALSRRGHVESAVIAALSGPIQNVLLTLGVSFIIACTRTPEKAVRLDSMDRTFYITGAWLLVSLVGLLGVVSWGYEYRIDRRLGWGLLGWYVAYLMVVLGSTFI